ncbi:hypothetical protein TRAPUB_6333 [Trametes pubescens]|uniref:F-box domain-containing protein n=1 Tax=Trametes pubescens TaxID=154538 RepID=A0A1M2V693_TRAPU|nr:hypothetical protein TRAPUB_6333 [Trametes pubescens]
MAIVATNQNTTHGFSRLPTELCAGVVKSLSKVDQRSCLSVSRLFRDLARPLVFSRVIIRVGMWKATDDEGMFDDDVELMERRVRRNKEKLQYIALDAQFARIVKAIHVHAHREWDFADLEEPQDKLEDNLDISLVVRALKALPHLRSFRWHGISPALTPAVLDALAKTCGRTLVELSVAAMINDDKAPQYLTQFKKLQALSLAGDMCNFPHYGNPEPESMVTACIQHVPLTVLRLSVLGDSVWDTPLRVLSGLYELSLQRPQSLDKLSVVFQHCSQLRTLNVLIDNVACKPQFIAALKAAPDALPHLTSFKFIACSRGAFNIDPDLFAAFLKDKKAMRRLDLTFYNPFKDIADYTRFLDMFASLPQLEVLGLVLKGEKFTREHLQLFDERLPLGLSALLLSWEFRSVVDIQKEDWIAMLKRRLSLAYLHVLDPRGSLDLCKLLLKDHPPALQFVGYGSCLGTFERNFATGEAAYGPVWDEETAGFRTVEDFGCEDWEWLLRNHDWNSLHSLEPYDYFRECWRHIHC